MCGVLAILTCLIPAAALAGCTFESGPSHRYGSADSAISANAPDGGFGRNDGYGYGAAFGSYQSDSNGTGGPRFYY